MSSFDPQVLREIIERIVRIATPERIVMFGSGASDRMGPDSDLDLLVISQHDSDRNQVLGDIYVELLGVGQAVDVVMVTPAEVERYRNSAGVIIGPALQHGKEVYRADTAAPR